MENLIKGIIEYREKFKEESSEAGLHYAMGWLNVEVKEGSKNYTSSDVLKLLEVIDNYSDFTHEKELICGSANIQGHKKDYELAKLF